MLSEVFRPFRPSARRTLPLLLNIAGLSLGFATCAVLALVVRAEMRFNADLPNAAHVWRLDEHWSEPGTQAYESAWSSFRTFAVLRPTAPEIRAATVVENHHADLLIGSVAAHVEIAFTDADFLRVFPLRFLRGARDAALADPDDIALSARAALARFGTLDIVGRRIDLKDAAGATSAYRVTGVFANPGPATDPHPDYIARMTRAQTDGSAFKNWGSSSGAVYLALPDRATAERLNRRLPDFVARFGAGAGALGRDLGAYALSLVNLRDAHFHDVSVEDTDDGVDRGAVLALGIIGALALGIAVLNYVNLSTAMAGIRAREVAMRKVLGASRGRLAAQFLSEAVLVAWVAALLALVLCESGIPVVSSLSGIAIGRSYAVLVPGLLGLATVCGVVSGVYPALVLSRFMPAAVLAAQRMPGGGRGAARLRSVLVVIQFGLAVTIAVCTLVVNAQAYFLRTADRGYRARDLLIMSQVTTPGDVLREHAVLAALRAVPGVMSATMSDQAPGTQAPSLTSLHRPGRTDEAMLLNERVSADYATTYGVRLLAGRWFSDRFGTDAGPANHFSGGIKGRALVLNAGAALALGYVRPADAIGQTVLRGSDTFTVIGVAADIRFRSSREQVKPLFYLYSHDPIPDAELAIRTNGTAVPIMRDRLIAAARTVLPGTSLRVETPDELLSDQYDPQRRQGLLFALGASVAIAIACVGLYGLTAFAVARRRHEIGVRKVLGADAGRVLRLLLWQNLRPVVLASVIACPIAWAAMRGWLAGFDQRVALSPAYFLLSAGGAVLLSAVTVASQTVRAARAAPAWALRQD